MRDLGLGVGHPLERMTTMIHSTTLENGVRVLTEHCPGTRSISIGALVDASPQDDPNDLLGLAHFTEHALFQGTSARSEMDISRLMDAAGGQMGAFTGRDYTCYYANVLDDYSTFAIDLLGDIICNSTFPEEQMLREQQAIVREIGQNVDSPDARLHTALKQLIWPGHPLGRPVYGNAEHVSRMTREDVIYFMEEHYTPDRLILCAAGNVVHELLVEQVRDALWRLDGSNPRRAASPCPFRPGIRIESSPESQSYFALALPVPAYASEDRYYWYILNTILGGGMSSRLFRRIREEMGCVYQIDSELNTYRDAGILVVEGSTAPESLRDVLAATMMELGKLAFGDQPVDDEEFWTARMQLRGQHLLASENLSTRMSRLATQEFYFSRQIGEDEVLRRINEVTLEDLQQFIDRALPEALGQIAVAVTGAVDCVERTEAAVQEIAGCFQTAGAVEA